MKYWRDNFIEHHIIYKSMQLPFMFWHSGGKREGRGKAEKEEEEEEEEELAKAGV